MENLQRKFLFAATLLLLFGERIGSLSNAVGLEAQVILARSDLLPDRAFPALIERLSTQPRRQISHRLLADELRLRVALKDRSSVVSALVRDYANAPLTNRLAVAGWLNPHNEFARTLELLPRDEALTNRNAFLLRLDALPPLGKWKEARAELQSERAPMEPVLRELFLVRTARELKLPAEAEAHWRRIHLELATKPDTILLVAEHAEKLGDNVVREIESL